MSDKRNKLIRDGSDLLKRITDEILVSDNQSLSLRVERVLESAAPAIGHRYWPTDRTEYQESDRKDPVWEELFTEMYWDYSCGCSATDFYEECRDAREFAARGPDRFFTTLGWDEDSLDRWNPTTLDIQVLLDPPDGMIPDHFLSVVEEVQVRENFKGGK